MREPRLAVEFEQKALKLIEIIKRRSDKGQDTIKYLSAVLLEFYDDGYNDCILDRKLT